MITSFYRMSLATLFLAPLVWGRRHAGRSAAAGMPLTWLWFPLAAGLFTAFDHATWSTALQMTTVANATLLNNLAPVWVALFALLVWRQRLTGRFWLGLLLACLGVFGIFGNTVLNQPSLSRGDALALSSSVFYAGYYLITQRGRQHVKTLTYIWFVDLAAAVVLLAVNLAAGNSLTGYSAVTYLTFLAATLISQIGGYFSITYALGHLPASIVAPTMIAQPVLTALLAIPLAGEALQPLQILSGLSVLAGIYLVLRSENGQRRRIPQSQ